MITSTVTENIELNIDLMKRIRNGRFELPYKRLEAATDFVDSIIKQLKSEDREQFEEQQDKGAGLQVKTRTMLAATMHLGGKERRVEQSADGLWYLSHPEGQAELGSEGKPFIDWYRQYKSEHPRIKSTMAYS